MEKQEHQDVGTEACPVNRAPSGPLPADCASCLSSLLRTLQQDGNNCQIIKTEGVFLWFCTFDTIMFRYVRYHYEQMPAATQ